MNFCLFTQKQTLFYTKTVMKKSAPLLLGLLMVVVIIYAGIYIVNQKRQIAMKAGTMTNSLVEKGQKEEKPFRDLMAIKTSQECSIEDAEGNEGTLHIDNGRVEGSFVKTEQGQKATMHLLTDTETLYIWTKGEYVGYRIPLAVITDKETYQDATSSIPFDLDQQVSYHCSDWQVTPETFTPPSDVTFTFTGPQPDTNQAEQITGTLDHEAECRACESSPADFREHCLESLQCN